MHCSERKKKKKKESVICKRKSKKKIVFGYIKRAQTPSIRK